MLAKLIDQSDLKSIDSVQKNMVIEKKISDESREPGIDNEFVRQFLELIFEEIYKIRTRLDKLKF